MVEQLFLQHILEFVSGTDAGFAIFSAILFHINSYIVSVVSWTAILRVAFSASGPVFVAVSNIFSRTCWTYFLQMTKIHIVWYIYLCSWFYRVTCLFYLLIRNVKSTLSAIFNGLSFWSVKIIVISSNSVL